MALLELDAAVAPAWIVSAERELLGVHPDVRDGDRFVGPLDWVVRVLVCDLRRRKRNWVLPRKCHQQLMSNCLAVAGSSPEMYSASPAGAPFHWAA